MSSPLSSPLVCDGGEERGDYSVCAGLLAEMQPGEVGDMLSALQEVSLPLSSRGKVTLFPRSADRCGEEGISLTLQEGLVLCCRFEERLSSLLRLLIPVKRDPALKRKWLMRVVRHVLKREASSPLTPTVEGKRIPL